MVLWQGLTEGGTAVPVQVTEAGKVVAEGQQGQEGPPGPPGEQGPQGPQGEYGPGDDVDLGKITAAGTITTPSSYLGGSNTYGSVLLPEGVIQACGASDVWQGFDKGNAAATTKISATGNITAAGALTTDGRITSKTGVNVDATNGFVSNTNSGFHFRGRRSDGTHAMEISANGDIIGDGSITTAGKAELAGQKHIFFTHGEAQLAGNKVNIQPSGSATFAENKAGFTSDGEVYFTSRGTRYKLEVAGGLCNAIPYTREMQLRERAEELRKPRSTDSVPED